MLPKNRATHDIPFELSDKAVEGLIKRLRYITMRLERHYLAQSHRLAKSHCVQHRHRECDCAAGAPESDPPF
jgi:hypothetical protein